MPKVVVDHLLCTELLHDHTPEYDLRYVNVTGDTMTGKLIISSGGLEVEGGVVFNETGADVDFRVEGDTDANLLFVDASFDAIGIGTTTFSGSKLAIDVTDKRAFTATATTTFTSANRYGGRIINTNTATSPSTAIIIGAQLTAAQNSTSTLSSLRGFWGGVDIDNTGAVTNTQALFPITSFNVDGTSVENLYSFYDQIFLGGTATAAAPTNIYHAKLAGAITSGVTCTNHYGLYINSINRGTTINNAITTNAGNIVFNEGGDASTDFRVEGDTIEDLLKVDAGNDQVETNGGRIVNITTVNAATYDLLITDDIVHVTYTSTGAVTSLTLPTAQVVAGRRIVIKDAGGQAATNNITVDTQGSETIDGVATFIIENDYESINLYSDGSNWFVY